MALSGAYRETVAAVLGERGVNHAVRCLAAIEVAVAVLVAFPGSRVPGLLVSCAVLAGYAGVMAYQLRWGDANLRCGCSGPASDTRIGSELVWRNLLLAGAASGRPPPQWLGEQTGSDWRLGSRW